MKRKLAATATEKAFAKRELRKTPVSKIAEEVLETKGKEKLTLKQVLSFIRRR